MKKIFIGLTISTLLIAPAFGENIPDQPKAPFRWVLGAGITGGGDKLTSVQYTDGKSTNITAGGGLQLLAGGDYRFNEQFSAQATVGYHIHFTPDASNGEASFDRIPVELLAYYHANQQWRIGGGVRFVSSAKLNASGAASTQFDSQSYQNATSGVVEAEYFVNPHFGVKLRGVKETYKDKNKSATYSPITKKYTINNFTNSYSGDHIGIFGNYYF